MGRPRHQYQEEELRAALATDPRVNEPELSVSIAGSTVIVRGVVPTQERREAVAAVVREVAPSLEFEDAMEVASDFPRPNGEEVVS